MKKLNKNLWKHKWKSLLFLIIIIVVIGSLSFTSINITDFSFSKCSSDKILVKDVCCDRASTCLRNADCPPCEEGYIEACIKNPDPENLCPKCKCVPTLGRGKELIGNEDCTIESQCTSDFDCSWNYRCFRCKCVGVSVG